MSEIKADYLDIFPEWIIEIIKKEKLTIDVPSKIDLVSSRTEFANLEDLEMLKPYIFKIITKYIVNLAID
jgi:septum formation topological specificity factor MinE